MNVGKTVFAQIMEFVPWTSFARIVQRYRGNAGEPVRLSPTGLPDHLICRTKVSVNAIDTPTGYLPTPIHTPKSGVCHDTAWNVLDRSSGNIVVSR